MNTYKLSGGDDGVYGTVFGPVIAEEVGEITYLADNHYLLLQVKGQLTIEGETARFLVVTPRYKGYTLESIRSEKVTVGIGRVRPGRDVDFKKGLGKDDVHYFAVGECEPIAP